ncbi:hypothetical protein ACP70R_022319 [Stipagrostis hirtigluma subsp. patula]
MRKLRAFFIQAPTHKREWGTKVHYRGDGHAPSVPKGFAADMLYELTTLRDNQV